MTGLASVEDHLTAADKLFNALDRNAVALSGLDGLLLLLAASDPIAGAGLRQWRWRTNYRAGEIGRALGDVVAFAHDLLHGITATGMAHGVVDQSNSTCCRMSAR